MNMILSHISHTGNQLFRSGQQLADMILLFRQNKSIQIFKSREVALSIFYPAIQGYGSTNPLVIQNEFLLQ